MGKGKTRKAKQASDSPSLDNPASHPLCTCGHSHDDPPVAADGHNVEGWTDEDIRIYNELLTERAKLEKEKNELEQKSARHQAERALLNEDAAAFDNLFKVQLSGEYKFTGTAACCLNFSDPIISKNKCHHEICSRAKSKGISWIELDTIRYYETRITTERSPRKKSALQKQRDVELERVKKEDEEELASRNRRSAMLDKARAKQDGSPEQKPSTKATSTASPLAATEKNLASIQRSSTILDALQTNETVISKLNVRTDNILRAFRAGEMSAIESSKKLADIDKELETATHQSEQFREMIFGAASSQDFSHVNSNLSRALSASLTASSKDAFTQALDVMRGFFSASDQKGVQAAIADLKGMLDGTPVMSSKYKHLKSLEDINALPNASGFSKNLIDFKGTPATCTNIVEVFTHFRNANDVGKLRDVVRELKIDDSLARANEAAMDIERKATREMFKNQARLVEHRSNPATLYSVFKETYDKAVESSALPALTGHVMELLQDQMFPRFIAYALIVEALKQKSEGMTIDERSLLATMTRLLMIYTERKSEKYASYFEIAEGELENVQPEYRKHPDILPILRRVLQEVQSKVMGSIKQAQKSQPMTPQTTGTTGSQAPFAAAVERHTQRLAAQEAKNAKKMVDLEKMKAAQLQNDLESIKSMLQGDESLTPEALLRFQESLELETQDSTNSGNSATVLQTSKAQHLSSTAQPTGQPKTTKFHENFASANNVPKTQKHVTTEELAKALAAAGVTPTPGTGENNSTSPPPYTANEGRARSAGIKVKHVPVNTPQISESVPPPSKDTNNNNRPPPLPAKTSPISLTGSPNSVSRQTNLRNQLIKMRGNLDKLKSSTEPPPVLGKDGLGLKDPFEGITNKIEEQYQGHLAMAKEIASANEWSGLTKWLEKQ